MISIVGYSDSFAYFHLSDLTKIESVVKKKRFIAFFSGVFEKKRIHTQ